VKQTLPGGNRTFRRFCIKKQEGQIMWGMIATWRMAAEGVEKGAHMLAEGQNAGDAIETAIREVEDFPYYKSVGYGGLPNEEMEVELDAAYMDGDTLDIGAVAAIKDYANPVSIARRLSHEKVNSMLVGEGAEKFAHKEGFERKNMLTDRAKAHYRNRVKEQREQELKPYSGHDTVGMVCLDSAGKVTAATSTSGLFMKKKGRVGDSPIAGSGFYADSEVGGASATGLGEDLMKGCISYETVRLMKEGMHPQEACETAVNRLDAELVRRRGTAGDLSLIAMNKDGEWGVATNIKGFSFVVVTEGREPQVYLVERQEDGRCTYAPASPEWMEEYMRTRMAPVVEK
jgi:isoaspartyl peptidase/L-asparaginase-like protein (Ntn-hydrolase superfamily)